jgi:hypothetical protein
MRGRIGDSPFGRAGRGEPDSESISDGVPDELSAAGSAELAELAREAGLRRVGLLAWRDIEDPEAGGSELHAHEVATRWAAAGIDVVVRTSSVAGRAVLVERGGYRS